MSVATLDSAPGRQEDRRPLIPSSVLAMLIFVFTEIMLFAGLISGHVIFMADQVGELWPPAGQPLLPVRETALNTGALILSGMMLLLSRFAFSQAPRRALVPLGLSVALGAFFVAFQGVEWAALIREGLTLQSSTYGAYFYLIVGTHALHAIVALLCLGWAFMGLRRGSLQRHHFDTVQLFWYFVVLVWPVIYLQVYQ